jgi:biopolymer transport protein TolR
VAFTASSGHTRTSLAEINITPLVDVVLVLLIIFMVTAPVLQSGIDVSVPKTRSVKEITQQRQVLTIGATAHALAQTQYRSSQPGHLSAG